MPDKPPWKPIPRESIPVQPAAKRLQVEVDYDAAIARAKNDLKSDFDFAIGGLKAHTERVLPAMVKAEVDAGLAPINARLEAQDVVAKDTKAIAEKTAKAVESIALEHTARSKLAQMKEEARVRSMDADTALKAATTQKIIIETHHAEEAPNPILVEKRKYRLQVAAIVLTAIGTISGLGYCGNRASEHAHAEPPHIENAETHH